MKQYWAGKKILVTGAGGFIGRHLVTGLQRLNVEVFAMVPEQKHVSRLSLQGDRIVVGNIADTECVMNIFRTRHFDVCYHLAAQPLVAVAQDNPIPTFEVNIQGTWNVLEAARRFGCSVILASTTHVYGDNAVPFREECDPRPSRPYETSKACADILAQTYARSFHLPVAIARFVNVYGPGDNNDRLIPRTIRRVASGEHPELYDERVERDYLFIDDAISAYVALGEYLGTSTQHGENIIYNFGTGKHYSTRTVVETILDIMQRTDLTPTVKQDARSQEILKQYVSIEKARTILQWNPKYSLEQGLTKTVQGYIYENVHT